MLKESKKKVTFKDLVLPAVRRCKLQLLADSIEPTIPLAESEYKLIIIRNGEEK